MTLNQVTEKFSNFKAFLDEHITEENEYLVKLKSLDTITFLGGIRANMSIISCNTEEERIEIAYGNILEKTGFDASGFSDDVVVKFKRYIEYFYKVSKCF